MSEFNLSKPNRAIRVGVILCNRSETPIPTGTYTGAS